MPENGGVSMWQKALLSLFLLLFYLENVYACEPVYPFMMTMGFPVFTLRFFSYGLLPIFLLVVVKGVLIAKFQKISLGLSLLLSCPTNCVSTLAGLVFSAFLASGPLFLPVLFLVCGIISLPVGFLMVKYEEFRFIETKSRVVVALCLTLLGVLSVLMFAFSGGYVASESPNLLVYWLVKITATTIAMLISILLTTAYEVVVISGLYRLIRKKELNFINSVLRANIIAILALSVAAALIVLPIRFNSPDWLLESNF